MLRTLDFDVATDKFYEVLIKKAPDIAVKFGDMQRQKTMMIVALRSIDDKVRDDGQLKDYMVMLGEKHKGYGFTEQHMKIGREAFEAAIDAGGKDISEERKQVYLDAFTELERMMGFDMDGTEDA